MKRIGKDEIKKIKNLFVALLCFAAISNGIMNYVAAGEADSDIMIQRAAEESPIAEESTSIEEPPKKNESEKPSIENEVKINPKSDKININAATSEELECLSGIGPTKSESIIAYREEYGGFASIEEINEVKGIGDATYLKIKDFISIQ